MFFIPHKKLSVPNNKTMDANLLLIENEEETAEFLRRELTAEGYRVEHTASGRTGLELALHKPWDLILMNIVLPELNGIEVIRRVRLAGVNIPIILLTTRNTTQEIVSGLDQGANDYVTKPFSIEELLARIRNLIRMYRTLQTGSSVLRVADLSIDLRSRQVERGGRTIEMTPREFDLLLYFIRNEGVTLSREQIISEVWGYDYIGDTNIVDVYVRYLRKKIDSGFPKKLIHTKRGAGYILQAT